MLCSLTVVRPSKRHCPVRWNAPALSDFPESTLPTLGLMYAPGPSLLGFQAGEYEMSAKILIVDDHVVVRQGLRSLLNARPDWEICGEAAAGEEAIHAVTNLKPDVVILDVTMPGMSGLEAASRIVALGTATRILIFTMHESLRMAVDVVTRLTSARGVLHPSLVGTRTLVE